MLSHSRPEHLRIPRPGQKNAESTAASSTDAAPSTDADVNPSVAPSETTTDTPSIAPEAPVTGSALEAWGSSDITLTTATPPRVRERGNPSRKARSAQPKNVQPKSAPNPKANPTSNIESAKLHDAHPNFVAHNDTRILVIENDIEAADHVIQILEADGYAVEIATDANYGAVLAQTFLPHLILLGAISEQLSGADFMRSLRNTAGFAERSQVTPVLYLIDNSQLIQQRFQGLRDTPLTSTIFKPANEHELLQKIERALSPSDNFPTDTL